MNIVFIENNRLVTDSLMVAETFGKRHDNVLRDIKELECSQEFSLLNFEESTYTAGNGKIYQKYLITQDGFSFLAFGYNGKEAARFKEMYINEFNRMRDELNKPKVPQTMIEALEGYLIELRRSEALEAEKKQLLLQNSQREEELRKQQPLVTFAQTCLASQNNVLVRELAKLASKNGVMIGEKGLYKKLREWGMILQQKNEPTQRGMELGLFQVKKGTYSTPEKTGDYHTITITPKGQMYIVERLQKESKLAIAQ